MADSLDLPVAATQTSTDIIETLADLDGAGVTAIAETLERSKSSVHDHLQTLTALGFVVKRGYEYRVGPRFLRLGSAAQRQYPIYTAGVGEVTQLVTASGCAAGLAIIEGDSVLSVHHRLGPDTETPTVAVGDTLPLHCTAAGKAILAALPDDRQAELLAAHDFDAGTDEAHADRTALETELRTVQARGIAVDREEWRPDQRGMAATVTDVDGGVCGAVYLRTDTERMSGKRFQQDLPGLVISSANGIRNSLRDA